IGTPTYMAPEQFEGEHEAFGPATDVYGLGVILYELLTGRPPFVARTAAAVMRMVLDTSPAPPTERRPGLDSRLERICLKMLSKRPEKRHPNMAALVTDLDVYLRQAPHDQLFAGDSSPDQVPSYVPNTCLSTSQPRAAPALQEQARLQCEVQPIELTT